MFRDRNSGVIIKSSFGNGSSTSFQLTQARIYAYGETHTRTVPLAARMNVARGRSSQRSGSAGTRSRREGAPFATGTKKSERGHFISSPGSSRSLTFFPLRPTAALDFLFSSSSFITSAYTAKSRWAAWQKIETVIKVTRAFQLLSAPQLYRGECELHSLFFGPWRRFEIFFFFVYLSICWFCIKLINSWLEINFSWLIMVFCNKDIIQQNHGALNIIIIFK